MTVLRFLTKINLGEQIFLCLFIISLNDDALKSFFSSSLLVDDCCCYVACLCVLLVHIFDGTITLIKFFKSQCFLVFSFLRLKLFILSSF